MAKLQGNKKIGIVVTVVIVIMWALLIYYLSGQPANQSNRSSFAVTKVIITTITKLTNTDFDAKSINRLVFQLNNFVRKLAHISLYFVLGLLAVYAIHKLGFAARKTYLIAICLCILYAMTDEWHQTYVPGRSGQISDVLIDTAGTLAGIGVYVLWLRLRKK